RERQRNPWASWLAGFQAYLSHHLEWPTSPLPPADPPCNRRHNRDGIDLPAWSCLPGRFALAAEPPRPEARKTVSPPLLTHSRYELGRALLALLTHTLGELIPVAR